jgi:hypothetical protein
MRFDSAYIKARAKFYRYVKGLGFNATLAALQGQVDVKDDPFSKDGPIPGMDTVTLRRAWLELTKGV